MGSGIFLQRQFFADYRRKALGRFYAQLLVNVESAKNNINVFRRHPERLRQESNHVIGRSPCHRGCGDADFKLMAFGFSNGVFPGARCPENIEHQSLSIPSAERFGLRCCCLRSAVHIAVHSLQYPIVCHVAGEPGESQTSRKGASLHQGLQKSIDIPGGTAVTDRNSSPK